MLFKASSSYALLVAASSALVASRSNALTTTWTNASGDRSWSNPANWSNGVPTAADAVLLNTTGNIILPLNPPATADTIDLRPSNAPFNDTTLSIGRLTASTISNNNFFRPLTITGTVGATGQTLRLNNVVVAGAVGDGAGGGTFDLAAWSTTIRGPASLTGDVYLTGSGTLEANGSVASASRVLLPWSFLFVNPSAASPALDRLPDTGELRLFGASLFFNTFNDATSGAIRETLGPIAPDRGISSLVLNAPSSGSLTLKSTSLARKSGAILQLFATGNVSLQSQEPPTGPDGATPTDRAVVGFGVGTLTNGPTGRDTFLTYDRGANPADPSDDLGLRALDWNIEHSSSIAGGGNVLLSGSQSLSGDATVRSLNLSDGSLHLASGMRLTVGSGMILQGTATPTGVGGDGHLVFPSEAIVHAVDDGVAYHIDSAIEAPSFTKGGTGELIVSRPNDIVGPVYISGGTLTSRASGGFGSGTVVLNGGVARAEQVSQTIEHVSFTGVYNDKAAAGGIAGLAAGPGTILTVRHIEGNAAITINGEGDGLVHIPSGGQYSVGFMIFSGELRVDGNYVPSGPFATVLQVESGTLGGTGVLDQVNSDNDPEAVISPGSGGGSVGTLTAKYFSIGESRPRPAVGPILRLDLNGTEPGVSYDQLVATTHATVSSAIFDIHVGYAAQLGDQFMILVNQGIFPFTASSQTVPAEGSTFSSGGYQFRITYQGGTGNDVVLTVVPEPASAAGVAIGAGLLFGARRKKSQELAHARLRRSSSDRGHLRP